MGLLPLHRFRDARRQSSSEDIVVMSTAREFPENPPPITLLLKRVEAGDAAARNELLDLVYVKLRALAGRAVGDSNHGTLNASVLVNEAYLKLFASPRPSFRDHRHFFRKASHAMRSIVIDGIRKKRREKRTPPGERVLLDAVLNQFEAVPHDLLAVNELLESLGEVNARALLVFELRYFSRHLMREIADIVGISQRKAERDWDFAKAFLKRALSMGTTQEFTNGTSS